MNIHNVVSELPGKTWTVLSDEEGGYNVTLPLGFGNVFSITTAQILDTTDSNNSIFENHFRF